jgi:hypothetical protein
MGRKKPFSGKQKKEQLKAKKTGQFQSGHHSHDPRSEVELEEDSSIVKGSGKNKLGEGSGLESSKFFESRPAPSRMNPGRLLIDTCNLLNMNFF